MTRTRLVFALLISITLPLAAAGSAHAKGACVHLTKMQDLEELTCKDSVSSERSCARMDLTGRGEFHADRTCHHFGFGVTWGNGSPPAKMQSVGGSSRHGVAKRLAENSIPPIPSPLGLE